MEEYQVYDDARMAFSLATGIQIAITHENGKTKYKVKDIEKIYKFYGLEM